MGWFTRTLSPKIPPPKVLSDHDICFMARQITVWCHNKRTIPTYMGHAMDYNALVELGKKDPAALKAVMEANMSILNTGIIAPGSGGIGIGGSGGSGLTQAVWGDQLSQQAHGYYPPLEKIQMRMKWQRHVGPPQGTKVFEAWEPINSDKAFVFIITEKNEYVVLEDEIALFPSDTLIASLRTLGL